MSAAINRSIASIKTELQFLRDSKVVSDAQYDLILSNLPQDKATSTSQDTYVEALYDYEPQQSDDLRLKTGDNVKVIEKMSADWWKGQIGSEIGVFPSNYVREASVPKYQEKQPVQQQQVQQSIYQQQPPQQYYQQQQQQPQQQQFYQQQVQQQPFQQQQVQEQPQKQSRVGKYGSQLGQAVVFGAGATIGSDLVHAIF